CMPSHIGDFILYLWVSGVSAADKVTRQMKIAEDSLVGRLLEDCSLVCSPSRVRQLHWSESVQSSATLDQSSIDRGRPIAGENGNLNLDATLACATSESEETALGRGLLLWLIGIPIPIILPIWLFGGLH